MISSPIDYQQIKAAANSELPGFLREHPQLMSALSDQRIRLHGETRMLTVREICRLLILRDSIDNELVKQKDRIRSLISQGKLAQATEILYFLEPFWNSQDYHYKFAELMLLIDNAKGKTCI